MTNLKTIKVYSQWNGMKQRGRAGEVVQMRARVEWVSWKVQDRQVSRWRQWSRHLHVGRAEKRVKQRHEKVTSEIKNTRYRTWDNAGDTLVETEQSGTGVRRRLGLCGGSGWEGITGASLCCRDSTTPTSTHTGREQVREKEWRNRARKQDATKLTQDASRHSSNKNDLNQVKDKVLDRCKLSVLCMHFHKLMAMHASSWLQTEVKSRMSKACS